MTKAPAVLLATFVSFCLPGAAPAQIVNGGFENGFSGWEPCVSFHRGPCISSPKQARIAVKTGAAHKGGYGLDLQVVSGDSTDDKSFVQAKVSQRVLMSTAGAYRVAASFNVLQPGGQSAVGLRMEVDEGEGRIKRYQDFAALEISGRQHVGTTVFIPPHGAWLKVEIVAGEHKDYASPLATKVTVDDVSISAEPIRAHPIKLHYRVAVAAGVRIDVPVDLMWIDAKAPVSAVATKPPDATVAALHLPASHEMTYRDIHAFAIGVTGDAGSKAGDTTSALLGFGDGQGGSAHVLIDVTVIEPIASPPKLMDPVRLAAAQTRYSGRLQWMVDAIDDPTTGLRAKANAMATSLPSPWVRASNGGDAVHYGGQAYYVCPEENCGCSLAYEPEQQTTYTCSCHPNHPPVEATPEIDRGWAYWRYFGAGSEVETAAVMYAITGEPGYAPKTRDLLVEFANNALRMPDVGAERMPDVRANEDTVWWSDPGKFLMPLFDAIIAVHLVRAYSYTRDAVDSSNDPVYSPSDRVLIEENLLRPLARMDLYRYNAGAGNHQTWHNTAAYILGAFLRDKAITTDALEGRQPWLSNDTLDGIDVWEQRFGIRWQLENSMDDRGYWWEGSTGYQYAGVNWPMLHLAQLNPTIEDFKNLRVPKLHSSGTKGIKELVEALFTISYPNNFNAPALNDNTGTVGIPAFFDAALGIYPDSEPLKYAFDRVFNLFQPPMFRRGFIDFEPHQVGNSVGVMMMRMFGGLWSDTPSPKDVVDPRVPQLLPTGVATLRTANTVVVFDHAHPIGTDPSWWQRQGWKPGTQFDGWHGHEDQLHIVFHGGKYEWLTDFGYDRPDSDGDPAEATAWGRDAVGHNLVMAGDLNKPDTWQQNLKTEGRSLGFAAGKRLQVAVGRSDNMHPEMTSYRQERWTFLLGDDLLFTWDRAKASPAKTFDRIDHLRGKFDSEKPNTPAPLPGAFGYGLLEKIERRPATQTVFDLDATKPDQDGASLRIVQFPQSSGHEIYTAELPYKVGKEQENLRVLIHRVPVTTDLKIGTLYEASDQGLDSDSLSVADAALLDDDPKPKLTFSRGADEYALTWSETDGTDAFLCVRAAGGEPLSAEKLRWVESLDGRKEPTRCGPVKWIPSVPAAAVFVETQSVVDGLWTLSVTARGSGTLALSPSEWEGLHEVQAQVDGATKTLTRSHGGFELALDAGDHLIEIGPSAGSDGGLYAGPDGGPDAGGVTAGESGGCDCNTSATGSGGLATALLVLLLFGLQTSARRTQLSRYGCGKAPSTPHA